MPRLVLLFVLLAGCATTNERGGGSSVRLIDAGPPALPPRDDPGEPLPPEAPPEEPLDAIDGGAASTPPEPGETPEIPMPELDGGGPDDPCMGLDYLGRCEGDVATWCGHDGRLRTRACTTYGMICAWVDASTGYYCVEGTAPELDAGTTPPIDAGAASDAGTAPMPPPGVGALTCRTWAEQHTSSGARWGDALTDIVRHLPRSYGDTYFDSDHVTYGHETSHGIHSHIRNYLNDTGARANGFYVMDDRACLVTEPRMRKSDVASFVPSSLRWSRYSLYITGSSAWDDTPLYVWDEWNAYVNGAEVGIERARTGLWTSGWRGTVDGVIEFVVYGIAVVMAAEARDPAWLTRDANALAFFAFELERSMRLFREGRTIPLMQWAEQDAYYERLRTGSEADAMRAFVRRHLGDAWTLRVMGF
ncbi:MAG: hypothetical protein M3Y87_17035 [Myxococcota bacterium]|nr:hypothetical protein [Myxococcota bacterium]